MNEQPAAQQALKDFGIISQDSRTTETAPDPKTFVQSTLSVLDDDTMHSVGLYSKEEIRSTRIDKFARFGRPLNIPGKLNPGREYLFFIKPDLHLCVPRESWTAVNMINIFEKAKKEQEKEQKDKVNSTVETGKETTLFNTSVPNKDEPRRKNNKDLEKLIQSQTVYDFTSFGLNPDIRPIPMGDFLMNPQIQHNGYFKNLLQSHPDVVRQLQYSLDPTNPFACILSGTASGFLSLSSSSAKTLDNSRTIFGNTYNYLQDSESSDNAQSFDIEFVDTKHLDVFNFFKAYNEYHIARKSGLITPPTMDYYRYRRLHNTMGVYKFVVDEDMSTILYWAYFWGVIPTSYPRDAFSDPTFNDGLTFSINFEAAFIDDLNPSILGNFNYLMGLKLLTHPDSSWDDIIYPKNKLKEKISGTKELSIDRYKEIMIDNEAPIHTLQDLLQHRKLGVTMQKWTPEFKDTIGVSAIPSSHTTMIDGRLAGGALVVPVTNEQGRFSHYKLIWYM